MLYPSSLALIGNTPLVELARIKIPNNNRIFAKLEGYNPAGGLKDRVAFFILNKLKTQGKLHKDSVIIEATAGNTGLGIAFVALHFGVRAILVVPEKFSIEKQNLMRALGAEIISTPKEDGMLGALEIAKKLLRENPHAISLNQFENLDNPQAHYESTAREIYADLAGVREGVLGRFSNFLESTQSGENSKCDKISDHNHKQANEAEAFLEASQSKPNHEARVCVELSGCAGNAAETSLEGCRTGHSQAPLKAACNLTSDSRLDYFICGAGSGGSFSGIARYLKEQDSRIQAILCDPIGSIIGGGVEGCANIEGIGNSFIPKTMDTSLIDGVEKISDEEAYQGLRILAKEEGILAGISSGACLQAALKVAATCKDSIIVTLFADDLSRYFSRDLI